MGFYVYRLKNNTEVPSKPEISKPQSAPSSWYAEKRHSNLIKVIKLL